MTIVYTIGHSNRSFDHFAGLLRQHGIGALVDVRSHPYSRYVPYFAKEPLSKALSAHGVRYVFFGDRLGGKLGDEYRDARGNFDFRRRASAPDFVAGMERLIAMAEVRQAALMCAEENPQRCHRRLLIAPALMERDIAVNHIRGDGRIESEEELPRRSPQMSLF